MALPVETFHVKTEGLPRRCEVCHQDDLFDPLSGHCGRCSALVFNPVTVPGPPAPVSADYKSGWWNIIALIGSALIGIFGLFVNLMLWITGVQYFSFPEMVLVAAITGFSAFGYRLLFWYTLIWIGETNSAQRRWIGMATVIYNLVIFLGVLLFGMYAGADIWFLNPVVPCWLAWLVFMMCYGSFLVRRESPVFRSVE